MKGKLVTFEGSEGSGKSTQIEMIHRYLADKKKSVLLLREPGGVFISEKIRDILLDVKNVNMTNECETLLYMAARAQMVGEILIPALQKGQIVLCDRYLDSTVVYQGYGCGVNVDFIRRLGAWATQGVKPDLTFIFDIEARKGLARIKRSKDRIERRALAYHDRVSQGYRKLAQAEPRRIKLIHVDKSIEEIFEEIRGHVEELLKG